MLSPVQTLDDLRAIYFLIEEGVAEISAKNGRESFIAPDVYRAIADGAHKAMVIHRDDYVWGWATYRVEPQVTGERLGTIIDTYIRPGAPKALVLEVLDGLEKAMAAEGAKQFHIYTSREGWKRKLAKAGYEVGGYLLTKEA